MTVERVVSENGAVTEIPQLTPDEVKLLWECKIIAIQRYDEAGEVLTKGFLEEGDASAGQVTRWQSGGLGGVTLGPRMRGSPLRQGSRG